MLLSEYQAQLAALIDRYARTDLIVASELNADARTPKIGVIKGTITFMDGSQFFFSEYVDVRYRLEKLSSPIIARMPMGIDLPLRQRCPQAAVILSLPQAPSQ